jgi:hypothetical protein
VSDTYQQSLDELKHYWNKRLCEEGLSVWRGTNKKLLYWGNLRNVLARASSLKPIMKQVNVRADRTLSAPNGKDSVRLYSCRRCAKNKPAEGFALKRPGRLREICTACASKERAAQRSKAKAKGQPK